MSTMLAVCWKRRSRRRRAISVVVVGLSVLLLMIVQQQQQQQRRRYAIRAGLVRQLQVSEPPSSASSASSSPRSSSSPSSSMPYNLPDWAETWCTPPKIPSLPFERCNKEGTVNSIRVFGGLTNALKFILLGSIYSFERDECFFIDESTARMRKRKDTSEQFDSLLQRYFEPMGLSANSADVQRAKQQDRVHVLHAVNDLFRSRHTRRAHGDTTELSTLGINEMDGHAMKKYMMRRLWRPLPEVRNHTCATLDTVHGLHDPYLAFSIRRGDKKEVEHFEYQDLDDYISQAEPLIVKHFDGVVPNIFVATDDCSVLPEFRKMRPEWTFLSECDRMDVEEQGFALADMSTWTKQQTDAHFRKFFVELYGLAIAKVYIGVSTTNVAWWAYFMRQDQWSFNLVNLGSQTKPRVAAW